MTRILTVTGLMSALLFSLPLGMAATQEEKEALLLEFAEGGDTKKLIDLKKLLSFKYTVVNASFMRRTLWEIAQKKEEMAAIREHILAVDANFRAENRRRSEQEFAYPKPTNNPEDIKDPKYRKLFKEYQAVLKLNKEYGGRMSSLEHSERSVRNMLAGIEKKLSPEQLAQLDREEAAGWPDVKREREPEPDAGDEGGPAPEPPVVEPAEPPTPVSGTEGAPARATPEKGGGGFPAWLPWAAGVVLCLGLVAWVRGGRAT